MIMQDMRVRVLFLMTSFANSACGKWKYLTITYVAMMIKTQLMRKRKDAPLKKLQFPFARPYPAVQRGGMRAVAIATPESTVPFSFLLISSMPARPPKRAISTS